MKKPTHVGFHRKKNGAKRIRIQCVNSARQVSMKKASKYLCLLHSIASLENPNVRGPALHRKMLFPFLDFKNLLIHIPLSLPYSTPVQPMIRVKMSRGNSNHHGHHTDVNDEPNNEIDDNRPESGRSMSLMSLIFPSRSLDIPPFPAYSSHQEDANDRVCKNNNEKDEGDLE